MIRTTKKTILKIFMVWHFMVLANRVQRKNIYFIMTDRPWWVVRTLAYKIDLPEDSDQDFKDCVLFLNSEAKKELYLRERQKV